MSMSLKAPILKKYVTEVFVETGSFDGGGIQVALDVGFQRIHSIEINPFRFNLCKKRFKGNEKVTLHCGDTIKILPRIVAALTKRGTFWLDAHTLNPEEKALGKRWPLMDELTIIAGMATRADHTIMVDDRRMFGELFGVTEADVLAELLRINSAYTISYESSDHPDDIIVAHIA